MQKPRILLSLGHEPVQAQAYQEALAAAGGEPVLRLPGAAPDLSYHGLLLGGEETSAPWEEDELALARTYIDYGRPILGIGRGAALLNAALGGSLWQCPGTAEHYAGAGETLHPVRAETNSLLWDLYDSAFTVNSRHRLAIRKPGCGILPTAWAPDGAIEGFEHERRPLLGVQWHPERCLAGEGGCAPGLPLLRYFLCLTLEGGADLHPPVGRDPDVRFACALIDQE